MNNYKVSIVLTLLCLITIYILYQNIRVDLTPNIYIVNTYLYIILGLLIIGDTWMILDGYSDENDSEQRFIFQNLLLVTAMSFVSLFVVMLTSNEYYIVKHIAWITFMLSLGVMSYVHYKINVENDTLKKTLFTLVIIMATLSYIAWMMPLDTFMSLEKPLLVILCILLLTEIFDYIINFDKTSGNFFDRRKLYSWGFIFVFSGFVLYDTQKLINDGKNISNACTAIENNQFICADYPRASLALVLDAINLFQNATNVNN